MTNPLIDEIREFAPKRISTFVNLPTQGKFYEEGEVFEEGVDYTNIEVFSIGIMDDINFKDPILLASGKGLETIMKKVCPSAIDPMSLAEVDIDAILIASRIISSGMEYPLHFKCSNPEKDTEGNPVCEHEHTLKLDLQDFIISRYGTLSFLDDYRLELENYGQVVFLRPLPYAILIETIKKTFEQIKHIDSLSNLTIDDVLSDPETLDRYVDNVETANKIVHQQMIHSIDSVLSKSGTMYYDIDVIEQWLEILPAEVIKSIKDRMSSLSQKMSELPLIECECENCGFKNKVMVQLSPDRLFLVELPDSNDQKTSSTSSTPIEKKRKRRLSTLPK